MLARVLDKTTNTYYKSVIYGKIDVGSYIKTQENSDDFLKCF